MACVLRRGDHVPFDAFIPTIRLVAPCRAIPLPARFVSGFGERASVPRLGFGLGRIWVSRVSLPFSIYYSCVYLKYIVIVIVICFRTSTESKHQEILDLQYHPTRIRGFTGIRVLVWELVCNSERHGIPVRLPSDFHRFMREKFIRVTAHDRIIQWIIRTGSHEND